MNSSKIISGIAFTLITAVSTPVLAQEVNSGKKGSSVTTEQSTTPTAREGKKTAGRIKTSKITRGMVINLATLKRVNAAEAGALTNKGALALMVGSRVVYVLKADGSSAGDDLARLADGTVGVAGKTVTRGGATVLLADVVDVVK